MITAKLGVGPMSKEIIDAVIDYSNQKKRQIMLICSRRQIECQELGGGYVENFTTQDYARYVRSRPSPYIILCRDHGGPYQGYDEKGLAPKEALKRAKLSFKKDIEAGFDLLHLDCSLLPEDVQASTLELLLFTQDYAQKLKQKIEYEIGTEENTGGRTSPKKFLAELKFFCSHQKPTFIVGQTGSLVKETSQVGSFNLKNTQKLVGLAQKFGAGFKEHNADYLTPIQIKKRRQAGVAALNIAPQLGVIQTQETIKAAQELDLTHLLNNFLNHAYASQKWQKWLHGQPSKNQKSIIAGHYIFTSPHYRKLYKKINNKIDLTHRIATSVAQTLDTYHQSLS